MYATRRYWTTAAIGGLLVLLAWVVDRPAPLYGATGLGAWLLATHYGAVRSFIETDDALEIDLSLTRPQATVEQDVHVTLTVERHQQTGDAVTVTAPLPPAAEGPAVDQRRVHLPPGDSSASASFTLTFPVAGQFALPQPTVTLADEPGQFETVIDRGEPPSVMIQPRQPRNVHIGQGGNEVAAAYGEHSTGKSGAGLTPVELRRYVPGDTAGRIDWKATARLDYPHVREYEAETDRQTLLVLDQRRQMSLGPDGETMLDYAREVALAIANASEELTDPLGLYAVGDEGLTTRQQPASSPDTYRQIRERLHDATPTESQPDSGPSRELVRPADIQRQAQHLSTDQSAFATKLKPFLTTADPYIERITGDPLFETIREYRVRESGITWTMLLTDDSDPGRVREVARLASDGGDHVTLFLTPRILYESNALTDLEAAYDRYLEFEQFRRELDNLPRVTALEVGPGDRLDALLAARQERR